MFDGEVASCYPFGTVFAVYLNNNDTLGDFIGFYECRDRGGTKAIKQGDVIDFYKKESDLQTFINMTYWNDANGTVFVIPYEEAKG